MATPHILMGESALILGITLLAPVQCLLLHASRARGGPFGQPWPASLRRVARGAVLISLLLMAAVLQASNGLALALVLPLSALSMTGMLYVALIQAWPRSTLALCALTTLGALVTLTAVALQHL